MKLSWREALLLGLGSVLLVVTWQQQRELDAVQERARQEVTRASKRAEQVERTLFETRLALDSALSVPPPPVRERIRVVRAAPIPVSVRPAVDSLIAACEAQAEQADSFRVLLRAARDSLSAAEQALRDLRVSARAALRPQSSGFARLLPRPSIGLQLGVGLDGRPYIGLGVTFGFRL